jgi:Ni/Co efflux regulator RcnB
MAAARRAPVMRQYISRHAIIRVETNIARCVVSTPALAGTQPAPICCRTTFNWSDDMKYLIVAMTVGAAALAGSSAANAANTGAKQNAPTDISAQHRHHHHGQRHQQWRHHQHGYYRPHHRSYGYYPRHHGYHGGGPYGYYGGGGPNVTFGFGGNRW